MPMTYRQLAIVLILSLLGACASSHSGLAAPANAGVFPVPPPTSDPTADLAAIEAALAKTVVEMVSGWTIDAHPTKANIGYFGGSSTRQFRALPGLQ
jgi:hypothetical protein